ncbi:MAG: hypothetical protein GY929_13050, partial [Actinomycetia bacterium]|nr:hypothetical protein [Actinomycetes bacterium]
MSDTTWARDIAAALAPVVDGRHQEIDDLRRLPPDIVDAMHEHQVFRTWLPDEFGGLEARLADGLELIEELSYLDSAVGWVAMINLTTSYLAGILDKEQARLVFADPRSVAAGTTAPTGSAVPADGGINVSGRWAWGSGIHNSTWMACAAVLQSAQGATNVMAMIPIEEIDILDTWQVSGMRGTGSTDYETHSVFVPDGRYLTLDNLTPWSDLPLHRFAVFGLLALAVSSVAQGLGRRALDEFRGLAAERTLLGTSATIDTSPVAQSGYAQAEAAVLSARAFRSATIDQAWQQALTGRPTREMRRQLRLAATNSSFAAAHSIDGLWELAGGGVVYDTSLMQRLQRDIHVLTQHVRVANRTWEMVGALALNQPFEGQL